MADVLKKFGRYFLLDHIAQGGMAEIYRAQMAAPEGGGRILAIKRIQAGYGENSEFLQMFKSEIQVTMQLGHPNIVQLFDYGEENGQPFIAMELVDGRNLRQLINKFAEKKQQFPVDLAAYIIEQAAAGLHFAHTFKNKLNNEQLNIVHRDISPQNILISYDGSVKVIDFGIAKAKTNGESTRAGVIKGKPSYLSPEQITGEALDGRCDIFALGIVLWELLVGRKLFAGDNDLAVLKQIEACDTIVKPPSAEVGAIPKEMDYIVLKCLARKREKRYQTGEELQRALNKFIHSFCPEFNTADLGYMMKDLYKEEIVGDRKHLQALNDRAKQILLTDIPESPSVGQAEVAPGGVPMAAVPGSGAPAKRDLPSGGRVLNPPGAAMAPPVELEAPTSAIRMPSIARGVPSSTPGGGKQTSFTSNTVTLAGSPPNAGGKVVSAPNLSAGPGGRSSARKSSKSGSSGGAMKFLLAAAAGVVAVAAFGPQFGVRVPYLSNLLESDSSGSGGGRKTAANGAGGGRHTASDQAPGAKAPELQQQAPTSAPASAPAKAIKVVFNILGSSPDTQIRVGGAPVDPLAPVAMVPFDTAVELSIEKPKYKPLKQQLLLESAQLKDNPQYVMDLRLEPMSYGTVAIKSTPSAEATIVALSRGVAGSSAASPGGESGASAYTLQTPTADLKLEPGVYSIHLINKVLGMSKKVQVKVEEGKSLNLDEKLDLNR